MKRTLIGTLVGLIIIGGLFFAFIPSYLESTINLIEPHDPYELSDEAKALHESLVVVDLHTDSMLWNRDPLDWGSTGHVDVPRMQAGNMALQVFSSTTKSPAGQNYESNSEDAPDQLTLAVVLQLWPLRTWNSIYERALYQAERLNAAATEAPDQLMVVRTAADLDALLANREGGSDQVGGVLLTEGSHPLEGDVANVATLHEAGYRIMGLQHFFDNRLGGSLHGLSGAGLTEFGREAIAEMNRLGIIIDVAHSSEQVVRDTLEIAAKPLIVSHTGFRGACDSPRNIPDALMQEIAAKGGLIGVGFWDGAVCDYSPAGIVRSIRYGIDLVGVDNVALGSDYDGSTKVALDASEIGILTQEMLNADFTEEEIRKVMGGNAVRFLRENLPQE